MPHVYLQDENGKNLAFCPVIFNQWDYVDHPDELEETCFLRFIDEYGNTIFNQYQLPLLIQELTALYPKSKNFHARESLEKLIEFIRSAEDEIHTYVNFVGD